MNENKQSYFDRFVGRLERFQASRPWIAFPYAVLRKFGEDQTGNYSALIAYYGFLSLFPLLLVLVSLLEIFLRGNGHLQTQILNNTLQYFPVLGDQLQGRIHTVSSNGIGVTIGIVLALLGARGVASVISDALNHLWRVPYDERPGFPSNLLRSLGMIIIMGLSIVISTALIAWSTYGAVIAVLVNVISFLAVFRLGVGNTIKTRQLVDSAVIAAIFWAILQTVGTALVKHQLHSLSIYGAFAVVLGLIWWLFIQSEVTLLAIEIHVVRELKLWPRSLTEPPLMPADKRAYTRYAMGEKRRPEQEVNVDFQE